jgi:hypothetical protein
MQTIVYEEGVAPNTQIGDYSFYSLQNVASIKTDETYHYGWTLTYNPSDLSGDMTRYFILDSENTGAFSHFVFEASIHLPMFRALKEKYPECKIALKNRRGFKKLFLDYSGVSWDDVVTFEELHPSNECFFHVYTSLNDKNVPPDYYTLSKHYLNSYASIPCDKTIKLLYLPRGSKENHQGSTDRTYPLQEELVKFVESVGGTVYWTDTTETLEDQIRIVRSAQIILCDYGSNLWVNGNFAKNSLIICMNIGWMHHTIYPAFKFLYDSILETNKYIEIRANHGETVDSKNLVYFPEQQVFTYILMALQQVY